MDSHTHTFKTDRKYCPNCFAQFDGAITSCPGDGTMLRGATNDPYIGKTFADKYEVCSVLGLGGMSIVYKAKHLYMDRIVAIKMLHSRLKGDPVAQERFKVESKAASALTHQNVISVFDFGITPDGEPYFVMDCLEGESLKELIERKGRIPYQRALGLFRQVADGLDAAHKKGVIHRDLKPANIILVKESDDTETVKLVDFGIAKMLPHDGQAAQKLTQTGEVFGSPMYMSPEQCLGKELDGRSDLYSFGCVMYEALTGTPPFEGASFLETMNLHVGTDPKPFKEVAADAKIPESVEAIVVKCLEKQPKDRFSSAGNLRDVIADTTFSLLGHSGRHVSSTGGTTLALKQKKQLPVWQVIAIASVLSLVGFFAYLSFYQGAPDDKGTLLEKMLWSLNLNDYETDLAAGKFDAAEQKVSEAEKRARDFGDGHQRLLKTLRSKSELYNAWPGHAEQLVSTNNEIARLEHENLVIEFERRKKALSTVQEQLTGSGTTTARVLAEAQISGVLFTAQKLNGAGMYEEQEELLQLCLANVRKASGADSTPVAPLEADLAECKQALRKYYEVRPLLLHVLKLSTEDGSDKVKSVRALSKLGQFDLDQNDFVNAEPEITKAYEQAKKLPEENRAILVLATRLYSDMLHQCGRKDQADKFLNEANSVHKGSKK